MEKLVYIRTDKNGTQIYHDYTCGRCGGAGYSDKWIFTGRTCFECGGKGVNPSRPHIVRKYTPEYEAKLEAKRKARHEKQEQELKAKAEQINAEFLATYFPNGKCYALAVEDPWAMMDELKAMGLKYANGLGYYFTEKPEKIPTVDISALEATYINKYGIRDFDYRLWELIRDKIKALKPVSQYVGSIGEKLTVKATYTHKAWFDSKYGTTYIHNFATDDGSILVWKTSVGNIGFADGERVEISATVKEHSEYKGDKQTVLTRCKFQ